MKLSRRRKRRRRRRRRYYTTHDTWLSSEEAGQWWWAECMDRIRLLIMQVLTVMLDQPAGAVHWAGGKHSNWITDANAATKHLFKGLMSSQAEVGDEWLHWLNDSTSKHLVLCTELNIPAGVISLFYSVPRNIICIFSSSVPMVK